MATVLLRLPEVKSQPDGRPGECIYCGGTLLQRWGRLSKRVRDTKEQQVEVERYRCYQCGRTFRFYPQGVGRGEQTERLASLAALAWVMGLSLRGVTAIFAAFGVSVGRMTVWRDVQALAARRRAGRPSRVRVLGVDGMLGKVAGQGEGIVVAVDLGSGEPVALGVVDERDPQALLAWLKPLAQELGVEVVVTDGLASYRLVAQELGLEHQVCLFHLRRWVGRSLRELARILGPPGEEAIERVRQMVEELPEDGAQQLFTLWQRLPAGRLGGDGLARAWYRLRQVVLRLSEHWQRYRLFLQRGDVPGTNNGTEQAIGRWRVRSRSVRGYKSQAGLAAAWWLCGARAD